MKIYGNATPAGPTNTHTPPATTRVTYRPSPRPARTSAFPPYNPNGNTPLREPKPKPAPRPKATNTRAGTPQSSAPQAGVPRNEPSVWTPDRLTQLEQLITQHRSILTAAQHMGITHDAANMARRKHLTHIGPLTGNTTVLTGTCVVCGAEFKSTDFPDPRQRQAGEFKKRKTCGRSCAAKYARSYGTTPRRRPGADLTGEHAAGGAA